MQENSMDLRNVFQHISACTNSYMNFICCGVSWELGHVSQNWKVDVPAIKSHIKIAKMIKLCVWGSVLCKENVKLIK